MVQPFRLAVQTLPRSTLSLTCTLSFWAIVVDARSSDVGLMADGNFPNFDFDRNCFSLPFHTYIIP
jgi:hypothetical protein